MEEKKLRRGKPWPILAMERCMVARFLSSRNLLLFSTSRFSLSFSLSQSLLYLSFSVCLSPSRALISSFSRNLLLFSSSLSMFCSVYIFASDAFSRFKLPLFLIISSSLLDELSLCCPLSLSLHLASHSRTPLFKKSS